MDIFTYIVIFIIGTVFGSFFTLAVYRIPLHKDITHERSFCPNCNHRLEFLDLIPVLSYIFLGGKCRYCGKKIRIRYLILEIVSGIVFLFTYLSFGIHFPYYNTSLIIDFLSFVFFYITIVIISGIDKEYKMVNKGTILFGTIMQAIYILYLYIVKGINVYRYSIYFVLLIVLEIICKIFSDKKSYVIDVLLASIYICFVTNIKFFGIVLLCTLFEITIYSLICRILKLKNKKISIVFFMGIAAIGFYMINNFFYLIK